MSGHKSRAQRIRERGMCRVYWGSHGCSKPRGHTGIHFCGRGCWIPDVTTVFFGEDAIPNDLRYITATPPQPADLS